MRKLLLTSGLVLAAVFSQAQCSEGLRLTVNPGTVVTNITGSGTAGLMFTIYADGNDLTPGTGEYFDFVYTINVKSVTSGTTVYTDNANVSFGSYTNGAADPCYAGCLCYVYRWTGLPAPGAPAVLNFTIPSQACGSYYIESVISGISYSSLPSGSRWIKAPNVGGGITTLTLPFSGSSSLGNTHLLNFSGTGGLAATAGVTHPTCGSANGSITISPSGGTSPYTYTWYGTTASGATASSLAAGTYTTTVTDAAGCARALTSTLTGTISVSISPGSQTVCKDKCLTLTATATPSGTYTYTWQRSVNGGAWSNIGTGSSICVRPTSTSSSSTTSNAYRVNVTSSTGCTGTASITITVDPSCTVSFYNGCCSGGGGGGSSSNGQGTTPDAASEEVILSISPNPAVTEAKIKFNVPAGNGRLEIYAMSGQLVKRIDELSGSGEVTLQLDEFAAGTYNVILYNGDVQQLNSKLVIQK